MSFNFDIVKKKNTFFNKKTNNFNTFFLSTSLQLIKKRVTDS